MRKVAVIDDFQGVAASLADWSVLSPDAQVDFFHDHRPDPEALVERLAPYEIVCVMRERTPFPREIFTRLPNLELLVTSGPRNAALDLEAAADHGVTVCGTGSGFFGTPELTWGLVLALARQIPVEDAGIRTGAWQLRVGMQLQGKTLGIVGLGRLGSVVAGYGKAFDMDVIAWSENLASVTAAEKGVTRVDKDELFARSDVVSIHVVLGARTRGLVGAKDLARMKPSAYLVNTSRGPIVDEQALAAALNDGTIAGAGVDVYSEEPVRADHPLLSAPNTVLTPHLGYVNDVDYSRFYTETVEDVRAWLDGAPLRVIVPA